MAHSGITAEAGLGGVRRVKMTCIEFQRSSLYPYSIVALLYIQRVLTTIHGISTLLILFWLTFHAGDLSAVRDHAQPHPSPQPQEVLVFAVPSQLSSLGSEDKLLARVSPRPNTCSPHCNRFLFVPSTLRGFCITSFLASHRS